MPQKRKWSVWRTYWLLWILVGFGIAEGYALVRKNTVGEDDNTLSEFVWDYFTSNWWGWVGIAGLLGWLFYHFLLQRNRD